ncbi:hypothetical protein CLG85_017845 [Yangia mangrovi]|uniref:Uncharacterized protein n=1 Tax=Alloyangia mangrovi TaxID=1779329 RepID=A0ABT2KMW8_9RHOB|nr:hypothetical protein [Alloyangia mangrovi]MCT4372074.1 hypothetical protein [Alloyangia mangrovi]
MDHQRLAAPGRGRGAPVGCGIIGRAEPRDPGFELRQRGADQTVLRAAEPDQPRQIDRGRDQGGARAGQPLAQREEQAARADAMGADAVVGAVRLDAAADRGDDVGKAAERAGRVQVAGQDQQVDRRPGPAQVAHKPGELPHLPVMAGYQQHPRRAGVRGRVAHQRRLCADPDQLRPVARDMGRIEVRRGAEVAAGQQPADQPRGDPCREMQGAAAGRNGAPGRGTPLGADRTSLVPQCHADLSLTRTTPTVQGLRHQPACDNSLSAGICLAF